MNDSDLATLAKAPLAIFLVITQAQGGASTRDRERFQQLVQEGCAENARKGSTVKIMSTLANQMTQLESELSQVHDVGTWLQEASAIMQTHLPPLKQTRFRIMLGRVAFDAVRDAVGVPIPARLAMAATLAESFAFPSYANFSKRFTDNVEAGSWWPGSDPALTGLSEREIKDLARSIQATVCSLLGFHGEDPSPQLMQNLNHATREAYAAPLQHTVTGALFRYHDQLFHFLGAEIQTAQSSLPLFLQGQAVLAAKLSPADQAQFVQTLHRLGTSLINAQAPPEANEMLGNIISMMRSGPSAGAVEEEELDLLGMGLCVAFFMIAAADGTIGKKECRAFAAVVQALALSEQANASVPGQVALRVVPQMERSFNTLSQNPRQAPAILHTAITVADRFLSEQDAFTYKRTLMLVAKKTAQAEGGFLGLGSKIDKTEREVLDFLSQYTRIPWETL